MIHVATYNPPRHVGKVALDDKGVIHSILLGDFLLLRLARVGDRQEWAVGGPGVEHQSHDFERELAVLVYHHKMTAPSDS